MKKHSGLQLIFAVLIFVVLSTSCLPKEKVPQQWVFQQSNSLDGVNPIGMALLNDELWISDSDHNRLVRVDTSGVILKTIDGLDRPMHIAATDAIYVPEYGRDTVAVFKEGDKEVLKVPETLDAPAGISVFKQEKAVADFYNNRILYFNGVSWLSIGKKGNGEGQFYYPTDVQITEDKIWVADAYNHRIQVFDKSGKFLQQMGRDQKMNAATGIYVSSTEVFSTDFENDRILVFDKEGNLKQELTHNVHKPTDMLLYKGDLYSINYRKGTMNRFVLRDIGKN